MKTKLLSLVALLIVAGAAVSVYAVSSGILTIDSNAESLQYVSGSGMTLTLKNAGSSTVVLESYQSTYPNGITDSVTYITPTPTMAPGALQNVTYNPTCFGPGACQSGTYHIHFTTQRGHIFDFSVNFNCTVRCYVE